MGRVESLQVGQLLVLPETAAWDVEWVVIEQSRTSAQLVPADIVPLAGRADLVVDDDEPAAPLTLRCGRPVEVAIDRLADARRSGQVSQAVIERARQLLSDPATEPAASQMEVELDPEYIDWMETSVEPARREMESHQGSAESGPTLRFPAPKGGTLRRIIWPVAATLILGLGLGFQMGARWEPQSDVRSNQAIVRFTNPSATIRSDSSRTHRVRQGDDVVLMFPLSRFETSSRFRLRIVDSSTDETVWLSELIASQTWEPNVSFPARFFAPGSYVVELERLAEDGRGELVIRQQLLVEPYNWAGFQLYDDWR